MEKNELIFTRSASGLVRELSWWDVFFMVIATPAASGILYYSVSTASTYPGGSVPLAFVIGLILFLPIAKFIGLISATMPRSGSLYVAVSRLLDPSIAYLGALMFFFGYSLTIGVLGYIVIGIIGGILVAGGLAGNVQLFVGLGETLQTQLWQTIGGGIWVLLAWLVTFRGIRAFRKTMRVIFSIPLIATIITICYFLFANPDGIAGAFNSSWGDGTYNKIITAARDNGWNTPTFSFSNTISLLLVVLWAYGGFEMIGFASGEIKNPSNSMLKGYKFGWIGVGILYITLSFAVFKPFGDFIGSYDFLYKNHQNVLEAIMPLISPSVPFYLQSIIGNPWIGITLSIALVFWFVNTMPPFFLANSRLLFALAMDRAVPEKLADVNPYTNAPTWATHLTAIFALLGVILNAFGVNVVLGTINFSIWLIVWMYGLSAMLLPLRKPDIYQASPNQKTYFGVPSISWLGFFVFCEGWIFVFISVAALDHWTMILLGVIMALIMFAYYFQQRINESKGIDTKQIYMSIPPE